MIIRPYQGTDHKKVMPLYRSCFKDYDGPYFEEKEEKFSNLLSPQNAVVAAEDDIILGLGTYATIADDQMRDQMETTLYWARRRSDRDDALLGYCKDIQKEFGGEIVMKFFENEYTNATFPIKDDDVYIDNLCVDQRYRKRGIGSKLAEENIRRARQQGATMAYISCAESSPSVTIFRKLPFLPLLRLGPSYANGSAALEMAMRLK